MAERTLFDFPFNVGKTRLENHQENIENIFKKYWKNIEKKNEKKIEKLEVLKFFGKFIKQCGKRNFFGIFENSCKNAFESFGIFE